MSWTQSAPTLPSGANWIKVTTGGRKENNVSVSTDVYIARLEENNVAIRFRMTSSEGEYGTYYPPGWVGFKVGSDTKAYGWGRSVTAYWIGARNEGASYTVKTGGGDSSSSPFNHNTYAEGTATGPAYVAPVYTIKYYANNGGTASSTQSKTWGYAATIRSNSWSKTGHAFAGWATSSSATTAQYQPGASYSTNADLTLYAVWAPNTYAVTYNGNGNDGGTQPAAQSKTYNVALTLQQNTYTKTGHHFTEWNKAADGSGTGYAAGGSYTTNAAATLYAIWAPDTYVVTFDGNGADGGSVEPQTKTYGAPLVLQQNGYTRQGYTFSGWNTAPDGSGTAYAAGATYSANAEATLYAQWAKASISAYVNVEINGVETICQVDKVYANVKISGVETIVECDVYANIDNEIVQIV